LKNYYCQKNKARRRYSLAILRDETIRLSCNYSEYCSYAQWWQWKAYTPGCIIKLHCYDAPPKNIKLKNNISLEMAVNMALQAMLQLNFYRNLIKQRKKEIQIFKILLEKI
jgi:hypothetical protein